MSWDAQALVANVNTGIEYEYALFYRLLDEVKRQAFKTQVIDRHRKGRKIERIIAATDLGGIMAKLSERGLDLVDCTMETQNDAIGPSDIVMHFGEGMEDIGISVKYHNTCTLNPTARDFLTERDIEELKVEQETHTRMYIDEMARKFGNAVAWFRNRKRSESTNRFIGLVRERVIANWPHLQNKKALVTRMFQMDSPIPYWVYEYRDNRQPRIYFDPFKVDVSRADEMAVKEYDSSYVSFHLDGRMIGKLQIKFNDGILEECDNGNPDFVEDGIWMSYGSPFTSWNFSVVYSESNQ